MKIRKKFYSRPPPSLPVSGEPSPLARHPHVAVLSAYWAELRPLSAGHIVQPHVVGHGRLGRVAQVAAGASKNKILPRFSL